MANRLILGSVRCCATQTSAILRRSPLSVIAIANNSKLNINHATCSTTILPQHGITLLAPRRRSFSTPTSNPPLPNNINDIIMKQPTGSPHKQAKYYTLVIKSLAAQGRVQDAIDVFDKMDELGVPKNIRHYTVMINMLGKNGDYVGINKMMKQIQQRGLECDIVTYGSIINALGLVGDIRGINKTIQIMRTVSNLEPNAAIITSIAKTYVRLGKISVALRLLDQFKALLQLQTFSNDNININNNNKKKKNISKMSTQDALYIYSTIIDGCSQPQDQSIDQCAQIALDLFNELCATYGSNVPDIRIYNALLNALGRALRIDDMLDTYRSLISQQRQQQPQPQQSHRLRPIVNTYTVMFDAFANFSGITQREDHLEQIGIQVSHLLNDMRNKYDVKPNLATITALFSIWSNLRSFDRIVDLYNTDVRPMLQELRKNNNNNNNSNRDRNRNRNRNRNRDEVPYYLRYFVVAADESASSSSSSSSSSSPISVVDASASSSASSSAATAADTPSEFPDESMFNQVIRAYVCIGDSAGAVRVFEEDMMRLRRITNPQMKTVQSAVLAYSDLTAHSGGQSRSRYMTKLQMWQNRLAIMRGD